MLTEIEIIMNPNKDDESQIKKLKRNLLKAKANEVKYKQIRKVLLDALSKDETTEDGQSQHEKLETVEKAIINNLSVLYDIEAILASKGRLDHDE